MLWPNTLPLDLSGEQFLTVGAGPGGLMLKAGLGTTSWGPVQNDNKAGTLRTYCMGTLLQAPLIQGP